MKIDIKDELLKYKEVLESRGFEVVYIGLYGSQNYNLNDEESDVDAKAIIIPSLHDIVFRKTISTTIECENGNIDVKDLITFYDVIRKGNFSYIESMNTEYWIGDPFIRNLFSSFKPNIKSILGAMHEKRKALTHPYPSKVGEFEKWGYDPKQHHHILRLYDLLKYDIENNKELSFLKYEDSERRTELLNCKRNKNDRPIEEVEKESDLIIEESKKIMPISYKYECPDISNIIFEYIENKLNK